MGQIKQLEQRLQQPGGSATKNRLRAEIANLKARVDTYDTDLFQIQQRIDDRHNGKSGEGDGGDSLEASGNSRLPNESTRDFLIRTGKITPFSKMAQVVPKVSANLADVMLSAEDDPEAESAEPDEQLESSLQVDAPRSHRNLLMPGFSDAESSEHGSTAAPARATKKRRLNGSERVRQSSAAEDASVGTSSTVERSEDDFVPDFDEEGRATSDGVDDGDDDDGLLDTIPAKRKAKSKKKSADSDAVEDQKEDLAGVDDGNEDVYQSRVKKWATRRREARLKARARQQLAQSASLSEDAGIDVDVAREGPRSEQPPADEEDEEWFQPHPTRPDTVLDGGFRIPGDIYPSLFDYQKTGVQWLCELYSQQVGGIIGDEMGLGKTIQIIAFLAGLHHSKKLTKPIIVVTPATVMKQWVNEFHRWWPPLRVSILHTSGSGMMDVKRERQMERELESRAWNGSREKMTKAQRAAQSIVDKVSRDGHVLVTTYSGLQTYSGLLLPVEWQYAVLDEGHKIRNPNTAITIYCKELRTTNRVILSGTPMQNNLTELWSLFDFVFPMRLGTLYKFRQQLEFPIKQGGYANASNLQVETAMKCAETLKDTISPYLLQRFKVDVAADLPKKSERVLFCKLTKVQREAYEAFLASEDMQSIIKGRRQALYGVDYLRKVCNHPDLTEHRTLSQKPNYNYGSGAKSGKMQVVKALLEIWKKDGHKTLLFAQHRIMLDILEKFVKTFEGFNYRRMDGNTNIKDRQDMVDEFNRDPDLHVFLLTTKVGGLGVNLTGADRVIIYDPDWNPSTDVQARERAWRLGQKREVEIYRLMTAGTIEEKIYHRQIFKQFLTNKILKDPKQRQTFQMRDLHDLFSLGDSTDGQTETSSLFKGTEVQFPEQKALKAGPGATTPPTDPPPPSLPTTSNKLPSITGVSREEAYHAAAPQPTNPSSTTQKPDPLLSTIFARSGVHSALEHDAILASSNRGSKVTADPAIIAREARRVAAEAARELQRAGEIARTVPAGTPTWTGQFGTAGRPDEPLRAIPARGPVFVNLQDRYGDIGGAGSGSGRSSGAASRAPSSSRSGISTPQPRGRDFIALIRDYLVAHGGAAHTQMLIDHFNRFCGTPQRTAEFREMLRTIAVLERPEDVGGLGGRGRGRQVGRGGRGKWVLKEEYRPK